MPSQLFQLEYEGGSVLMCGSNPLDEVVTRSMGIFAWEAPGKSFESLYVPRFVSSGLHL